MTAVNDRTRNLRTFYTLIGTQTLSLIGSRMTGLALGIYLFNSTGDVTPLALVSLMAFLPQVIAASFAGVLADRWDRRKVMILADAGQAFGTLLLLIAFLSGAFEVWMLYGVTLLQAVFSVFQSPAFSASVTMLVPDDQRDRANAIQQLSGPAAGVVAPAVAGGLYALIGLTGVIMIDLISFLFAVVVVLLIHIPRPPESAEGRALKGSMLREAFGGLQFLLKRRTLFGSILHISLVNFLLSGTTVLLAPYVLARTGSEAALGVLFAIFNIGGVVGGVIMSVWGGTKPRIHTIMIGITISGIALALIGISQSFAALAVTMFLLLLPIPFINAAAMSMMQTKTPPDMQGRIFAVMGQISTLLIPLSYLIVGPLVDNVVEPAVGQAGWARVAPLVGNTQGAGMGLVMFVAGTVLAILTLAVYAIPAVRHMEANLPDYAPEASDTPTDEPPAPDMPAAPDVPAGALAG